MLPSAPFQAFQRAFAAHLRQPRRLARPAGVSTRGAGIYAELVFTNLCGFVDACFPVCRAVLGEPRWRRLCRAFQRERQLTTPWFREIAGEFADYLASVAAGRRLPRWLPELARYEWAELAVDIMDVPRPAHDRQGDLLSRPLLANPALLRLSGQWPVQRIGPDWRPRRPQPTHLVVYRDADERVRFCELNALTAALLDRIIAAPCTGHAALSELAAAQGLAADATFFEHGRAALADLREQGILLGSQP